jgi:hypothetical protein
MSKSSKLSTAIKAFNVSECVRDWDGNIMPSCLIPTDLNYWAGLEVFTVKDLEYIIDFRHGFSDYHKDVHGFRPRWDTSEYTLSTWRKTYKALEREMEQVLKDEKEREALAVESFKTAIAKLKRNGAKDFMTALRWMMEAEDVDKRYKQDVEHFFWNHGILYTSYGKSLVKRLCPQKHIN